MSAWGTEDSGWGTGDAATSSDFGWGNGPAVVNGAGNGWNGGTTTSSADGQWNGGGATSGGDSFGFENMSIGPKNDNANGNEGAGNPGGDRACFNCGETGHNKADCPKPRVPNGPCRHCNEEGHWSKECPNAPPMECRECGSADHLVKDCPDRKCKNCGEHGHTVSQCQNARKIDRSHLADMSTEEAWNLIQRAVKERDIDDVKEAIQTYVKSAPETTYPELERAFRAQDVPLWLIAIEKQSLAATLTNMDLQGNLGKKYTVTYRFQWNPPRPRDREVWPKDVEENIERLKDAGEVVSRGLPKCANCEEIGHIAKTCPQEKVVKTVSAVNCRMAGPVPRVDKFACKNCGQSGHRASDCPEPRSAANVECRKCGEVGHFSRDCPQGDGGDRACRNCGQEGHMARDCTEPRNIASVQCRNCDEFGHMSKDCPKPRDITRVKCNNCQQMGHYKSKCPNPLVPEDDNNDGFGNVITDSAGFDNGGFDNGGFENDGFGGGSAANNGTHGWEPAPAQAW